MNGVTAFLLGLNILGAGFLVFAGCMAIRQGLIYVADAIKGLK